MSLAWKVGVTVVLFAVAAAAAVVLIVNLLGTPPTVDFYAAGPGQPVSVTLQTVGSYGSGSHPTWVSYLVQSPARASGSTRRFSRSRPARRINVTIYNYDSGSPLRNQQIGQVSGTSGNVATLNGKPFRVINSNAGNGVGHTFSMPSLGINVPALRQQRERQPLRRRTVHDEVAQQGHQVLLHESRARELSLAVLRPLRPWLPLRQRRTHVDGRLHGRLHEGGGVSDTHRSRAAAAAPAATSSSPPDETAPLVAADRHLGRTVGHSGPALLLPGRPAHPAGHHDRRRPGGAVRLQRPLRDRPARSCSPSGSTSSTPSSCGGRRGADPSRWAARRRRATSGIQLGWILTTTVIVLFLFGFGTYELVQPGGAGGGQGSSPIWTPTSKTILPIQVIGQQWKFTYRYPTFGGFETDQLVIPDDTTIQFNVTSLDVIHSFWAYQLGVKADANPDYNNVAYTTTQQLGSFTVRCAELCGLWHGAMYNNGAVVTTAAVRGLGQARPQSRLRKNTKLLAAVRAAPTRRTPTVPTAATTPTTSTRTRRWRRTARRTAKSSGDMSVRARNAVTVRLSTERGCPPWPLTTTVGEFEYPGEEELGTPHARCRGPARSGLAASQCAVGHGRRRRRLPDRPLAGQRHRQRLPDRSRARAERRRHRARPVPRGRGLDGRHRRVQLPVGQDPRLRALARPAGAELGRATSA